MDLDIFVVEEAMDLGEAQLAYESYPEAAEAFRGKLSEYKGLVESLKQKDSKRITREDMERADRLYEEAKALRQELADMKAVLSRKIEELVGECKDLEVELAYHSKTFRSEDGQAVQGLLSEAMQLKGDSPLEAVEKACSARDMLSSLLAKARDVWIVKHRGNLDTFRAGLEA